MTDYAVWMVAILLARCGLGLPRANMQTYEGLSGCEKRNSLGLPLGNSIRVSKYGAEGLRTSARGSAKIDAMNRGEDRVFAAALGNIEKTIIPGEILEIFRAEADKLERQLFAPVFLDVTNEFLGDVNFP